MVIKPKLVPYFPIELSPCVEYEALPVVALSHHPVGPEDPRVGPGVGLLLSKQGPCQLMCSCVEKKLSFSSMHAPRRISSGGHFVTTHFPLNANLTIGGPGHRSL